MTTEQSPENKSAIDRAGREVQDALTGTIKGAGNVVQAAIDVTHDVTVKTLNATGSLVKETGGLGSLLSSTLNGAINTARSTGANIGLTAKGAVIGTIQGAGEITTVTAAVLSDTVRSAIKGQPR
ncbi:MAG: hypothetical protein O3B04_09185 [Chloroflexi bacterium]|nr:hypothetical protein [Chloroflexota bacterium]MDA1298152.1 hypothetical protein [Chloroflexota bacterium]